MGVDELRLANSLPRAITIIPGSSSTPSPSAFEPKRTPPIIKLVSPIWSIHDERGDVDGRDIFVHESFNLGDFRTPAGNIGGGGSEDRNGRDQ